MSFKIKALLLVVICSGGVRNEASESDGNVAAEDVALLTHFLQTIDAATDEDDLINVTSTILNNLCACIRDTLDEAHPNALNKSVNDVVPDAGDDLAHYESIYNKTCRDLALHQLDLPSPQTREYKKKCSRFDFVRKYEEAFMDNQLKSKFKKIMYNILIKSQDRHKYEIKKYNLYEKPQTFERNAMRSVIIIITLNFSKSFKAKPEASAVRLSEVEAALAARGDVYVDFIDPAYDPKHTKISSAKNVSYCNLKSVLTVLLESEKNNLTKTFKLIRKGGTIKVYTSLSTNYAYERYSDICCYKNNTNTFCETTMKDVDPDESKLYKGERTERNSKYKETVSKIKALIQIYNKKLMSRASKAVTVMTEKVQITNSKNHYRSNIVIDHKNRSTDISDRHFSYNYKKFMSSKLNNLPKTENKLTRNSSFLVTNHTAADSKLYSRTTTDLMDVTNNEVSNTLEAEKIYLKVCNYGMWSNTTMKDFSPYKYVISNKELQNTTYTSVPLQAPTEAIVRDDSLPAQHSATYPSNFVGSTRQIIYDQGKFERNETGLQKPLTSNEYNKGTTNIVTYNRTTNTLTSDLVTTPTKFDKRFTKIYSSEGTNRSLLKSVKHTSPLNVLDEVNYVSIMMNSLSSGNLNINKITKRWTTPNVTDITWPDSKALSLLESHGVTTSYPSFLSTLNLNKQNQTFKMNSSRSRNLESTPYNNITYSSTEATTSAENSVRKRTIRIIKKQQLPQRYIEKNDQKRIASQNTVIQPQESKTTPLNEYLLPASIARSSNKKNTSYNEGTTIFLVNNIKTDIRLDLQTSTELPTRAIYSKKAHEQSNLATEYFSFTSNPLIQKGTTALPSVHSFIHTSTIRSISPQVPTVLYSDTISTTTMTSFNKNYTKSETTSAGGRIVNGSLNAQQQLNNKSMVSPQIKKDKYLNSSLTVLKVATTTSHSVHNVTETATSLPIPTLLSSQSVASPSLKQNKKSATKSLLKQLVNDVKSFNNEAKLLTTNSEKYQITTTGIEQTKSTGVNTLSTYYIPSNVAVQEDRVTTARSVQHLTRAVVSPQIPTFVYSASVTSTSSAFNNTTRGDTKPGHTDSGNSIKSNNQVKSQTNTGAKYFKLNSTTLNPSTPRSTEIDIKKRIASDLARTTRKDKSDGKYKKKYLFTKTTHEEIITLESWNSGPYFKNKINKLTNKEAFDKYSSYEYTTNNVDEAKSNSNNASRIISATDVSNFTDNYSTIENNKDYLIFTDSLNSENKSNSPLFEQQMNTTPLQKSNKISNKYITKAIINKTKVIESNILSKHINNKTSIKNYNTTKNVSALSGGYTLAFSSLKMPPKQLRLNPKVTSAPITSPDGQPNVLYVRRDFTLPTSTRKMKSNKKTTALKQQSRNTIEISALAQTPTVSKLKVARVVDIVDHTRGQIDLGPRQRLRQGPTFLATNTDNNKKYGAEIPNYKNNIKMDPTALFPTYFKATQRENRIYDNFFKITQSTNSIADAKALLPNKIYPKKVIEIRTLNKVNSVNISKGFISEHISKSTMPLPLRITTGVHNKKYVLSRTSNTSASLSKLQEITAKAKNITRISTTASKLQTIPLPYNGQNTLSGDINKTSYTYPMSDRAGNSRLPEQSKVILTTKPIQNHTTLSLATGSSVWDAPASTSPRARAPVAVRPGTTYDPLISKLEITTKGTPITGYKQRSKLRYPVQRSTQANTTQINKSYIPTTAKALNFKHTVETKDKNAGKSMENQPKKYSLPYSTITKTITSGNFLQVKTVGLSVPTELNSSDEAHRADIMKSTEINTLSAFENHLNQSKVKNVSKVNYLSDFKDIVKTISILQNSSTSEQTLAIDAHDTIQYLNEASHSTQSITKNITTNMSEIETHSYKVNQVKLTKLSVPLIHQNSIGFDTTKNFVTTEYISKINPKDILQTLMLTDNTDRYSSKEIMQTIADHSEHFLSDTLSSGSKQNKSFEKGTKVSVANTPHLNGNSFTSPDFTKSTENNASNIQFGRSSQEPTNSLTDLTTKPINYEGIKAIPKKIKLSSESYASIPSPNFKDEIKQYSQSNDTDKEKTTSEKYGQFHHMKTNETQFSATNVFNGTLPSRVEESLKIDNIQEKHQKPGEAFGKLFYFKSQVNSTPAVQGHSSESNPRDATRGSHLSNVEEIYSSTNINNDTMQLVHGDMNSITKHTESVFGVSSPLLQYTHAPNTYDTTYTHYRQSLSTTLASVAPPQAYPDDMQTDIPATNSYNESLQNIAQTLSNLLINSKSNSSIEHAGILRNDTKNDNNKTITLCNGPLIIASNVILLTNPESCGNQSKIESAVNMRFPLIILTNSSDPSIKINLDLNKTNKSIIKMDPLTVYNILYENVDKISKDPNKYLRINDLSKTAVNSNIGLGYDVNAATPHETRGDEDVPLDNTTFRAVAQSFYEPKKGRGDEMPQSSDAVVGSSSYFVNLNNAQTDEVTEWWLDDMYLKVRLPLPINSNPGMIFPRQRFARLEEVAELAALLLDDLLDYQEMLDRGELPLERATSREKGQPLCMQQFYRLLGVCRLPVAGRDTLHLPPPPPPHLDHQDELVVVACRNYFYPVSVRCARGRRSPGEIRAQLLHAMVEAAGLPPAPRLGLLTALPRDLWAAARLQLDKEPQNRSNLEQISRALCLLCVDEAGGEPEDADADTAAMLRAMHGAGSHHHSANRWFDKTVQLIVASDGMVGMCYEHSAAEGVAVVRLAERALARAAVAERPAPPAHAAHPTQPLPAPMRWLLTPDLHRLIERAAEHIDRQIADLDFVVYTYEGYGREFMKACRTSPDVYIQLALQYTYYKLHGRLVSTYESASLRRFRDGRVDNIRSAHAAARVWAEAMCQQPAPGHAPDPDPARKVSFDLHGPASEAQTATVLSEQRKLQLFEEAARKQTAVMEANILGRGIDNHLLGLREAARATGAGALPPLFTDPTYKQMMEFKLSTSQVATTTEGTCMGYGAVVPDGYGCSYNPKKDRVIFCIASFRSSRDTSTPAFRRALQAALDDMRRIFPHL